METETQNVTETEDFTKKRGFFINHKKSSALVVTIVLHALFVVAAVTVVVVKMLPEPPADFEAKTVDRPQPKIKRLEVPVKENKKKAPKLREMIVTKPNVAVSLVMPQMVGIKGGSGFENGTGLGSMGLGFDLDLFGGGNNSGNEFVGTFYDLKQTPEGDSTDINEGDFIDIIEGFVSSGFEERKLRKYFKAPKLKYTTAFMLPPMSASAAPKAFGVENQVKPKQWICHYKGKISAPETGRYRLWGLGDDILSVRVDGKLRLDACWVEHIGRLSDWESDDDDNRKFPSDTQFPRNLGVDRSYMQRSSTLVVGDWFTLRKGQPVNMEVLIGEFPGGAFSARLLIEQEGKDYKMVSSSAGRHPVLPVFKTVPINEKLIGQMNIDPNIATLEGPDFGVLVNQ